MTNLKEVNIGHNKFCGPAVLSILTGKSTDECASVIAGINGQYGVTGVQLSHLITAANKLGFRCETEQSGGSLFGTIVRLINDNGIYILTLPKHFVVIEINDKKAYFCDNHTKEPIPAASSARLTQQVLSAHKVSKKPEPKLLSSKIILSLQSNYKITIKRYIEYDDISVNRIDYIGDIKTSSHEDLEEIIKQLKEISNECTTTSNETL